MTEKQRKLVSDNHNLIYGFLHEYGFDREDFYDLAAIGLCKAAMKYDETKGVFSKFAYIHMLREIDHYFTIQNYKKRIPESLITHYNKKIRDDSDEEIENFINYKIYREQFEDDLVFELCVEKVKERMSDRDKLIFDMLIDGYTTREIGKAAGCSSVSVTNIRRRMCGLFNELI